MAQTDIQSARRQAEDAVADMPAGELKVKAFEVILAHLLGATTTAADSPPVSKRSAKVKRVAEVLHAANSCTGRIMLLKNQGFFAEQRTIRDVRDELARHGWHYPASTLSGKLQTLVQRRELRRIRVKEGNRDIWKYSLP
jgi:hypothetical protein